MDAISLLIGISFGIFLAVVIVSVSVCELTR